MTTMHEDERTIGESLQAAPGQAATSGSGTQGGAEHRRSPRRRANVVIQVTNAITGEIMGRIGNASVDGLMLVTGKPVVDDALFQLIFHLPDSRARLQPIEVGVHEQWSEPANVPGQHWAGFRIIDISAIDRDVLSDWLESAENRFD